MKAHAGLGRTARRHGDRQTVTVDHDTGSGYTDGVPNESVNSFTVDMDLFEPEVEQRLGDAGNPETETDKVGYVPRPEVDSIESTAGQDITAGDQVTLSSGRTYDVVSVNKVDLDQWRVELEEIDLDG